MAWNGSDREVKVRGEGEQRKGSSSSVRPASARGPYRGLVAGLIVVALGCGAIWWFVGGRGATRPTEAGPRIPHDRAIAEATPQIVTNKVEAPPRQLTAEERRLKELKYFEDKYGTNIPPSLRTHIYYLRNPPQKTFRFNSKYSFFKHSSERDIAGIMLCEPGTRFIQCPKYGAAFDNDFMAAYLEKIEIGEDDSDEVKEAKREVQELKKQMADIVRAEGKKPSEIMNEQAETMFKLGNFKTELMQELNKAYSSEDLTDAEVQDYCDAVDKMLESRGLAKMPHRNLTKRSLHLQLLAKRRERTSRKTKETKEKK